MHIRLQEAGTLGHLKGNFLCPASLEKSPQDSELASGFGALSSLAGRVWGKSVQLGFHQGLVPQQQLL